MKVVDAVVKALVFESSPVSGDLEDIRSELDKGDVGDAIGLEGEVEFWVKQADFCRAGAA